MAIRAAVSHANGGGAVRSPAEFLDTEVSPASDGDRTTACRLGARPMKISDAVPLPGLTYNFRESRDHISISVKYL